MATPSFSVIAEDDLTCPVCFELLRDPNTPKLLDCPHVCCAVCIQKMVKGGRRIVDCPECRRVTRIPTDGVAAMKTNLRVRSLAEKHEEHTKKAQATAPNQDHPRKKTHTTRDPDTSPGMCPEHNSVIDFYCKKCNTAGCAVCMMYIHQGPQHDNVQVQDIYQAQKGHMEATIKQGAQEVEECMQSVQELKALQDEMEKSLNIKYENIEKQAQLAHKKVNEEAQTLWDDLRKKEQPRIEHVQQERNQLENQIQEATAFITTAKNTMERTDKHDYVVTHHDRLAQTAESILGRDTKGKINRNMPIDTTRYVCDEPLNMRGNLGRIFKELKCELIQEFGELQWASAITATPSGLLVVTDFKAKQVFIYSQQTNGQYRKQSRLSLSSNNTTAEPQDVAVTAEGKYLVARGSHIELYSPSGKYERKLNFRQKDQKGNKIVDADRIKVMQYGRIVVADWKESKCAILSQEESILGVVHTSIMPVRMAVMPVGHIAVRNCTGFVNRVNDKVCVIDLESGRELQAFDIPHGKGLCYDEQTDCLLVGRYLPNPGTAVIDQYCCSTGRLVACIAEGLYGPKDLTFTPDGMLAVADQKSVKLYKVV